jgi:hypothetical protein
VLFGTALVSSPAARGQTAYFSATGSFTIPTAPFTDVRFTLPDTADLTMRTWSHGGGTNAAGQNIAPGGIDARLALFDNASSLIAENDNISKTELDALIHRPAQGPGAYRLRLTAAPGMTGPWATDLVRANGSMTISGVQYQEGVVGRLTFGAAGSSRATLDLQSATPLNIAGSLEAQSGGVVRIGGGTHLVGGVTTIGPGATLRHDGGYFRANQGFLVNGGSLESVSSVTFNNLLLGRVSVSNGGVATFLAADLDHPMVSTGGRVIGPRLFASEGASVIDGPGSHAHVTGSNTFGRGIYVGRGPGSNGSLTFSNHSSALVSDGTVFVGAGLAQSSGGIGLLRVNNASITVAGGNVLVGNDGGQGTFELDGPDARFTHTGAGTMDIGVWSGPPFVEPGAGGVTVSNGAVFTAPAGGVTIGHTGRLTIFGGGRFVAPGGIGFRYHGSVSRPVIDIAGSADAWQGQLDLVQSGFNFLLVTPFWRDAHIDQLRSGYNAGAWNGSGIMSSAAAADPGFALGYRLNSTADVLDVRYTRYGDADLDRAVTLSDFDVLAANFGQAARHWHEGNFNYDDIVNLDDFNLLAANFGLVASGPEVTPGDWAALAAAVPEPAGALFAMLMSISLMRARRSSSCSR